MSELMPDNDKILSNDLPVAIGEFLRVCGGDLKHNNFHLLHEAKAEIERLNTVISNLRGLVRAVASETSIPMEHIEQSIDGALGKEND